MKTEIEWFHVISSAPAFCIITAISHWRIVVLVFYLLYMCIKIELLCISIFVTRRSGNTVIHSNLWNTPFWSQGPVCPAPVCVRSFVYLFVRSLSWVKLWNIKTTRKGIIISSIARPSTIFKFYAWKVRRGGGGHLVIGSFVGPSICPSVCLSVIPSRLQSEIFKVWVMIQ